MGTRSTTKIYENGKFVLGLYKQYDGNIDSWGKTLKEFIKSGVFVNGINESKQGSKKYIFNGIGDFALLLVKEFKEGTGDLYATTEDDEQEYNYKIEYSNIRGKERKATLKISCKEEESFDETLKFEVI